MSDKVDRDLLGLLHNYELTDARLKAWEYVLGLTSTSEGVFHLLSSKAYLICFMEHMDESIADPKSREFAHKCLINISSKNEGAKELLTLKSDLVLNILNDICDPSLELVQEKCYILSNLSTFCDFRNVENLLASLPVILKAVMKHFCSSNQKLRENYKFMALVFSNMSKHSEFRNILAEEKYLMDFTNLISNENAMCRLGIALVFRNFCSDTTFHHHLLHTVNVLPFLLLPLMGPEEYDDDEMDKFPLDCQFLEETKKREKSPQIRRSLVQALSLLCYTEDGWNHLKSKGVYYVVRELHKWESDPDVIEAIETLVAYLLVEHYTALDKSDSFPEPAETDVLNDVPDIIL